MLRNTSVINGYYLESGGKFQNIYHDSTVYNNYTTTVNGDRLFFSMKVRASYDITKYLSVFVLRNFGIYYKEPWWMVGLQYYPFKNYR
jgi:hypothetical protein